VLVARDGEETEPFAAMLRAVVDARRHRYLMLNAPEDRLDEIAGLVAPRIPSVIPLAQRGMVAVHALVPAADVWRLLPQLEAAGASAILIVPVERMAA
jgi:ATP phosphoribosyltransferase